MGQSSSKNDNNAASMRSLYACCVPNVKQEAILPVKEGEMGTAEWTRIAASYNLQGSKYRPFDQYVFVKSFVDLIKVEQFIRGDIQQSIFATLLSCMPKRKLSIFVSSTFTDTYRERSILHEEILPELQKRAARDDIQVLFYDMRFGVKDDSSLDHTIWKTCQNAIIQCQSESDGLFFLSLQGDKYGYRALPKLIDREEFETILKQPEISPDIQEMCQTWYRLNTNYVPAKYELKDLRNQNDTHYWTTVLPTLRDQLLNSVSFDNNTPALLTNRSMTEWETIFAALYLPSHHKGHWIKRDLDFPSLLELKRASMKKVQDFSDGLEDTSVQEHLQALRQFLTSHYEIVRPVPFERLSVQQYLQMEDKSGIEYLEKWKIAVTNHLLTEVDHCIELSEVWKLWLTTQFGLSLDLMEDILHHHSLAAKKAMHFFGREALVQEAIHLILTASAKQKQRLTSHQYSAITAAIIGSSGAGKTSLLSKIAATLPNIVVAETLPPIIIRFCGTSRYSLHGIHLMQSISAHILCLYKAKSELQILQQRFSGQKYEEAFEDFSQILQEYPIILFIDSLDALSNRDEARSKLSFLRNLTLHEQSHIIVSTLPDEYDMISQRWIYRYFCEKVLRDNQIPLLEMMDYTMDAIAIQQTMECLLFQRQRTLSPEQYSIVLTAARPEPTMLYLNLSLEVITKWRSWERDLELRPTVKGLIHQIFHEFEKQYGQALISYGFAMITFAREGMNDIEMKDCLSLLPEVFQEVTQYWQDVKSVPLHVWLRVKMMIQTLLAEKEHACMQWYHRQLKETAEERYHTIQGACHRILGRYFSSQSLLLNSNMIVIWQKQSIINTRRIKEAYYHLFAAKLYEETLEEMCHLERICGAAIAKDGYPFLSVLSELLNIIQKIPTFPADRMQRLEHYYRWIRRDISSIMKNPRIWIPATASAEPLSSLVRRDSREIVKPSKSDPKLLGSFLPTEIVWMEHTLNGVKDYTSLMVNLIGHKQTVRTVAWHPQGSKIASGSWDQMVKIWDAATGEMICTLEGHEERVTSVSWSPDGCKLVSGSWDQCLKVWDSLTGELLFTIGKKPVQEDQKAETEGEEKLESLDRIESVCWSKDGLKIASGGWDCKVRIWDANEGELWKTFIGHDAYVSVVQWHPFDHNCLASASFDKTIRIWEVSTATVRHCLEGHRNGIESISWSRDGHQIVSGSGDNTIKVWNTTLGEIVSSWELGSSGLVTSVAWTRGEGGSHTKEEDEEEEEFIASAHSDCSIKVWDAFTGELRLVLEGHRYGVEVIAWHPQRHIIASGSFDKVIKIWDTSVMNNHDTDSHQAIIIRNFSREKESSNDDAAGHDQRVECVAWDPSGSRIASCSSDTTIKIWDTNSAEVQITLRGHRKEVTSVAWHPIDGKKLVSASNDKTIRVWDVDRGALLLTLEGHENFITSVCWNNKGDTLVSGSYDHTLRLWESETGKCVQTWQGHADRVMTVAWSPDDLKVASGSGDHSVKVWNVENGKVLCSLVGHEDDVTSISWHPNSRLLVSSSLDKTLQIWDVLKKGKVMSLLGHLDRVESVSWSTDGLRIASGSWDRTVKIWDAVSGEVLTTGEGHGQYVTTVAWHPNNHSQVASGSRDTTIKIMTCLLSTIATNMSMK